MSQIDTLVFGQRLRHLRRERGLTLDALGGKVGKAGSYLSLVENGHREVRLSLIEALADALDVGPGELLSAEPPNRRAHLTMALQRAQEDPLYQDLRLPWLKPSAAVPDDVLEHVVALYEALRQRAQVQASTPEAARLANVELRAEMRARNNYFPEIEQVAADALAAVGYDGSGAIAERMLSDLVGYYGFSLHRVHDLPVSVRSLTDLGRHRIYIHQRNALSTRDARSVVLQTLGHFALAHGEPGDFGEFLRQQVEANYFAGAVLAPEGPAVGILGRARADDDISVEDLKQVFYISYEMAAHRLTNLITHHFDLPVHFVRADAEGVIGKAYENDGIPFPTDADGVIEGQRVCREWGTRRAFSSDEKFADHAQYTSTPAGEFWFGTHVEVEREEAVTIGTRAADARRFRGSDTANRSVSRCPHGECCRRPPAELAAVWQPRAWPLARTHSQVVATLPAGPFPGVDLNEAYAFLARQTHSGAG
ncbi:MAG: family transcriptional regulator, fatty acid utilization regulator [Actinomycetota bacterium]|nr:family transcriptional regulator, fatty acid utilization regulator [Actinomycetota bacterium]